MTRDNTCYRAGAGGARDRAPDVSQCCPDAATTSKFPFDFPLVANRSSKLPFGFPLETKQALGVARGLTELCLTFSVPRVIHCDGGKDFGAEVLTHERRWLHAGIVLEPTNRPRGQGSVERLGSWLQDLLSELCRWWPERWDKHVSPAIWI